LEATTSTKDYLGQSRSEVGCVSDFEKRQSCLETLETQQLLLTCPFQDMPFADTTFPFSKNSSPTVPGNHLQDPGPFQARHHGEIDQEGQAWNPGYGQMAFPLVAMGQQWHLKVAKHMWRKAGLNLNHRHVEFTCISYGNFSYGNFLSNKK
jgi:hypothetical protein